MPLGRFGSGGTSFSGAGRGRRAGFAWLAFGRRAFAFGASFGRSTGGFFGATGGRGGSLVTGAAGGGGRGRVQRGAPVAEPAGVLLSPRPAPWSAARGKG